MPYAIRAFGHARMHTGSATVMGFRFGYDPITGMPISTADTPHVSRGHRLRHPSIHARQQGLLPPSATLLATYSAQPEVLRSPTAMSLTQARKKKLEYKGLLWVPAVKSDKARLSPNRRLCSVCASVHGSLPGQFDLKTVHQIQVL